MTERPTCRMTRFSRLERAVLLRMVADGCASLGQWGSSCTELTSWDEGLGADQVALGDACTTLQAKGLIADIGGNYLFLYRPTVAGVRLVVRWLQRFLAYPPLEEACCHD
jgi:hypothetical protein